MTGIENDEFSQKWQNCKIRCVEGDQSTMMNFHSHEHYEVCLILSGNVKTLLKDHSFEGTQSRLVLMGPRTPHLMFLVSPGLYSRINLYFTREFLEDYVPEWRSLVKVFGKNGNIVLLTEEQRDFCREKMLAIGEESDSFRQRLRILSFLAYAGDFDGQRDAHSADSPPPYIIEALSYIEGHYSERIVADELAWQLGVGRTTLMTAFRKHTGTTLAEYVTRVRVKEAVYLLKRGISQERVAESVGLSSSGGLIRAFRHCYGMTPRQYMKTGYTREGESSL